LLIFVLVIVSLTTITLVTGYDPPGHMPSISYFHSTLSAMPLIILISPSAIIIIIIIIQGRYL